MLLESQNSPEILSFELFRRVSIPARRRAELIPKKSMRTSSFVSRPVVDIDGYVPRPSDDRWDKFDGIKLID